MYMNISYEGSGGAVCLGAGVVGSGFLACWGVWCLMFAGGGGGEGRSRVSGWPFRNEEERRVKRERGVGRKRG